MDEENRDNIGEAKEKIAQAKKESEQMAKVATKLAAGNYAGAIKDALKSNIVKKRIKKVLITIAVKLFIPVLIVVILASSVFSVFNRIKKEEVSLKSGMHIVKTGFFSRIWQKWTDDYWLDLNGDESFREYLISKETGKTVAYINEEGEEIIFNKEDLKDLAGTTLVNQLTDDQIKELTKKYLDDLRSRGLIENKKYNMVDSYIKDLGDQGISAKDLRIIGEAEYADLNDIIADQDNNGQNSENKKKVEKYISEFIRADYITQNVHRRNTGLEVVKEDEQNKIDGGIYIYRTDITENLNNLLIPNNLPVTDYEKEPTLPDDYKRLKYIPYESDSTGLTNSFEKMIKDNDTDALNYFSTKEVDDVEMIVIATVKAKTVKKEKEQSGDSLKPGFEDINDQPIDINFEYELEEKTFDYKKEAAKYAMPYEFLINLCQVTQNPEYVYHLALLARSTEIVFSIQDKIHIDRTINENYYEKHYFKNEASSTTPEEPTAGPFKSKTRTIITNYSEKPSFKLEYADAWNYYHEIRYLKKINAVINEVVGDIEPQEVPGTLGNYHEPDHYYPSGYYYDTFVTGKAYSFQDITIDIWYEKDKETEILKSKQFLGLLRNRYGNCDYDCYEEIKEDENPIALDCTNESCYDAYGKNTKYIVPGTNKYETPLNKFESGLDMLYAILQSNSKGFTAGDVLLNQDSLGELYKQHQNYLKNNKYEESYRISMQEIVEYLKKVMGYDADHEGFHAKDFEVEDWVYTKKWDLFNNTTNTDDPDDDEEVEPIVPTITPTPGTPTPKPPVGTYIWPINDSNPESKITSKFGPRKAPKKGASTNHGGIDLGVPVGTPVLATADGKVTFTGNANNAGIMVTIDHQNGMVSKYMHLSKVVVNKGDMVTQGQVIAYSGNTGNSTGPHLHFQMELNGVKVDPLLYLPRGGGTPTPTPTPTPNSPDIPGIDAQKFDVICAVVAQECGSSYEGALAVITCVLNRCNSPKWQGYGGNDPYKQITAKGQFSYSIDGLYQKYLNGKYPAHVAQAVRDAINSGARNHNYLSFRTDSEKARKNHPIGQSIGGNWYFNS